MSPKRQAVLLIHGIGEQRPMDTLRGFVHAVWITDDDVKHKHAKPGLYSRPDKISENYDLRLLTTTKDRNSNRTDFYEFYWAHHMQGTRLSNVTAWAKGIVFRSPGSVPRALLPAWCAIWILLAAALVLIANAKLPEPFRLFVVPAWLAAIPLIPLATFFILPLFLNIVGDAARYLDRAPPNIESREKIRKHGVEALRKLQQATYKGRPLYDRIIIVGHSLGSVIGYDILTNAWPDCNEAGDPSTAHPELDLVEEMASAGVPDLDKFRDAQRRLLDECAERGIGWRITDFLTLGSPLAHAAILLAKDSKGLQTKQAERELPICPPELEGTRFSYPGDKPVRTPHHAAPFGPTRWTNLYFPCRAVAFGDLIGGPLRPVFGRGVQDRAVHTRQRGGLFSHTLYWSLGRGGSAPPHIKALRDALNLLDEPAAPGGSVNGGGA
jgi:hypothetical protein